LQQRRELLVVLQITYDNIGNVRLLEALPAPSVLVSVHGHAFPSIRITIEESRVALSDYRQSARMRPVTAKEIGDPWHHRRAPGAGRYARVEHRLLRTNTSGSRQVSRSEAMTQVNIGRFNPDAFVYGVGASKQN